jgi:hypothetical protein
VIGDLTRIVKDPWKVGPVVVDRNALIGELDPGETVSVRLDPLLEETVVEPGSGRPHRAAERLLVFRRAKSRRCSPRAGGSSRRSSGSSARSTRCRKS